MKISRLINKKSILCSIPLTLYILAALAINLEPVYENGSVLTHVFSNMRLSVIGIIAAGVIIYCFTVVASNILFTLKKSYAIASVPIALLFAVFIPLGRVFRSYDGFWIINANSIQIIKTVIIVSGYALLFYAAVIILFRILIFIDSHSVGTANSAKDKLSSFFTDHRFLFLLILVLFTSVLFYILYPGFVVVDAKEQLKEAFGLRVYSESYFNYLYPDSSLTNMRPVLSTLFIKGCALAGKSIFNSYTAGLGLYVFSQMMLMDIAVWRICLILSKKNIKGIYILFLLIFLYCNPLFMTLMFTTTKDTIYMACLMLFISQFWIISSGQGRKKNYIAAAVFSLISAAFRSDAIYTIITVLVVYAVYSFITGKQFALKMFAVVFSIGLIFVHIIWSNAVLPAMHVSPMKKSIQASVPLQQTARYVLFHWQDITEEERKAIDAIVDYDSIYDNYEPTYGDTIIAATKNFSDEEFSAFIKTWISLCGKDPGLALTAWLHNKYEFFYFEDTTFYYYGLSIGLEEAENLNRDGAEYLNMDFNIQYPDGFISSVREFVDKIWQSESLVPVWNLIASPAFYMLLLIMLTIFFFIRKNAAGKIFILFPWLIFLITNAFSAMNGHYSRYMYPIVVLLPIILLLSAGCGKSAADVDVPEHKS